jgi:hypothetical protein
LFLLLFAAAGQTPALRTFDDDGVGKAPSGFTLASGRQAPADRWVVQRDAASQFLMHAGTSGEPDGFAVAIYERQRFEDADMSVRLKAIGGSRAGGLVWKYQDPLNHYVVLLDLADQEVALYRVVRGNRIRIEREDDLELDPQAWHTLRIVQDEGMMRVYLGGIRVFSNRDRTFRGPGGVGLWSQGDAVIAFDDFRVQTRMERQR